MTSNANEWRFFKSNRVVVGDKIIPAGILVDEDGFIVDLYTAGDFDAQASKRAAIANVRIVQREDFNNLVMMPGLIDPHVHCNEPGHTDWEGFETATKAAAAGGFTTIADMPLNSLPVTTTVAAFNEKKDSARSKIYVDTCFWGGIIPNSHKDVRPLWEAGVIGFKAFLCESGLPEFPHVSPDELQMALSQFSSLERCPAIAVHAEYLDPTKKQPQPSSTADPLQYNTFLKTRPADVEVDGALVVAQLAKKLPSIHFHIVHVSSALVLDIIKGFYADNPAARNLTAETCHHYLNFTSEKIGAGEVYYKCCPPIREKANQELLWQGIKDGVIQMVASDHSPTTPENKLANPDQADYGNFLKSWGGIGSNQLGLSLFWTNAAKYGFTIQDMVRLMSEEPAKLLGLDNRKGFLKPGYRADFCVWDPDSNFTVTEDKIHFRHKGNPYMKQLLTGKVLTTIIGGQIAYKRDAKGETFQQIGKMILRPY